MNGKMLVGFGATAHHCSYYPGSGSIVALFRNKLENFGTSKGAIRFLPDKPLPVSLVRKLVRARLAELKR